MARLSEGRRARLRRAGGLVGWGAIGALQVRFVYGCCGLMAMC